MLPLPRASAHQLLPRLATTTPFLSFAFAADAAAGFLFLRALQCPSLQRSLSLYTNSSCCYSSLFLCPLPLLHARMLKERKRESCIETDNAAEISAVITTSTLYTCAPRCSICAAAARSCSCCSFSARIVFFNARETRLGLL